MARRRRLTAHHLHAHPGLSRAGREALLAAQPITVLDALRIPGVGRKTTAKLLTLGLVSDPDGVQHHTLAAVAGAVRHQS